MSIIGYDLIWGFRARLILGIEHGCRTHPKLSLSLWAAPRKGTCTMVLLSHLFVGDAGDLAQGFLMLDT